MQFYGSFQKPLPSVVIIFCWFFGGVNSVGWSERYNVDPRRSALVWTTGHNISLVVCPTDPATTTVAPEEDMARTARDHNIALNLSPDVVLDIDQERELIRREERIKAIFDGALGDIRIINQDRARLLGELIGEVVSRCMREAGASETSADPTLELTYIDGLVLPLGGAVARLFLERPPPIEHMAERHTDFDLGANTFMKINSLQNVTIVRSLIAEIHWEALARYGMKILGNTLTREEYFDAVGFALGLTMSLTQQLNGTVLLQDVTTTARKYVGNFLRAYLLMSNQYFSFMDHSIAWLADDLAVYASNDILRIRDTSASESVRQEWSKYAAEANKGLRSLRLISLSLLLSYRNDPTEVKFQPADAMLQIVPPSWMAIRYLLPAV